MNRIYRVGKGGLGYNPKLHLKGVVLRGGRLRGKGRILTETKTYPTYHMALKNPEEEEEEGKVPEERTYPIYYLTLKNPEDEEAEEQKVDINTDIDVLNYLYNKGDSDDRLLLSGLYGREIIDTLDATETIETVDDVKEELEDTKQETEIEEELDKKSSLDKSQLNELNDKLMSITIQKIKEAKERYEKMQGFKTIKKTPLNELKKATVQMKDINESNLTPEEKAEELYRVYQDVREVRTNVRQTPEYLATTTPQQRMLINEKLKEDVKTIDKKIVDIDKKIETHEKIKQDLIEKVNNTDDFVVEELFTGFINDEDEIIKKLDELKKAYDIKKAHIALKVVRPGAPQTVKSMFKALAKEKREKEMKAKKEQHTEVVYKYPKNVLKDIKLNKEKLDEYTTNNPDVVFNGEYPEEIKKVIESIEKVRKGFFDTDEKKVESLNTGIDRRISESLYKDDEEHDDENTYFQRALEYIMSIEVNGKKKFVDEKGKLKTASALKAFFSAGKPCEFGVCGEDNELARAIYGLEHPDFEITDFIVEDAGSSLGGQFPIDNVDMRNCVFNEMKFYSTSITYRTALELQIRLKRRYYNELLTLMKENMEIRQDALNEGEQQKATAAMQNIKSLKKVLIDKDEFNKDFYKNADGGYVGIGVTMNKFNPIIIPEDYDFEDSPSSEEQLLEVQSNQGQKFIPEIMNRKLIGMKAKPAKTKETQIKNRKFNKAIKEKFFSGGEEYSYTITCAMRDAVGVYDYTKDKYVKDDFILGTYKAGYSHDDKEGNFNGVLIPIEKFELPEEPEEPAPPTKKKVAKKATKGKKKSAEI